MKARSSEGRTPHSPRAETWIDNGAAGGELVGARLAALAATCDVVLSRCNERTRDGRQLLPEGVWIPLLDFMATVPALKDMSCSSLKIYGQQSHFDCPTCSRIRKTGGHVKKRRELVAA